MLGDGELNLLYLTPEYISNNSELLRNRLGKNIGWPFFHYLTSSFFIYLNVFFLMRYVYVIDCKVQFLLLIICFA